MCLTLELLGLLESFNSNLLSGETTSHGKLLCVPGNTDAAVVSVCVSVCLSVCICVFVCI